MSFAVRRPVANPSSSGGGAHGGHPTAPPPLPTTAPVLDFICLFTHDLRRKQKRWQDGRLKYHTFNRRVMVYDERGNFIGDAHWPPGAGDLDEGEELELDRGAAIVQVAECAGVREQDLSEVLDRRVRDVERRRAEREAKTTTTPGRTPRGATTDGPVAAAARAAPERQQQQQTHFQLNHRPLSAIVPSPGPLGRAAVPQESPFEARRRVEEENAGERPDADTQRGAKRRKVGMPSPPSKAGYAQSLFGTRLTLSGCPSSSAEAWARVRALKERTNLQGRSQELLDKGQRRERDMPDDEDVDVVMVERSTRETPGSSPHFAAPATRGTPRPAARTLGQASRKVHQEATSDEQQTSRVNATKPNARQALGSIRENRPPTRKLPISSTPMDLTGDDEVMEIDTPVPREPARTRITSVPARKEMGKALNHLPPPKPQEQQRQRERYTGRSSSQDQDEAISRPEGPPAPLKEAGPRTELRIRARQRRGLLMVAERKQQVNRSHSSATPDSSGVSVGAESLNRTAKLSEQPRAKRQRAEDTPEPEDFDVASEAEPAAPGADLDNASDVDRPGGGGAGPVFAESSSDSDAPPVRRKVQRKKPNTIDTDKEASSVEGDERASDGSQGKPASPASSDQSVIAPARPTRSSRRRRRSPTPDPFDDDSDGASSPPRAKERKASRKKAQAVEPPEDKPAPSGPRITKMARKSVKSREIIGFVVRDNVVPASFAAATGRIGLGIPAPVPPTVGVAASSARASTDIDTTKVATAMETAGPAMHSGAGAGDSTAEPTSKLNDSNGGVALQTNGRPDITERAEAVEQRAPTTASDSTNPPLQAQSRPEEAVEHTTRPSNAPPAAAEPTKSAPTNQTTTSPEHSDTPAATAAPKPRIANPATRGRKAARKEDAAGQAPQTLVPLEPPAVISVRPRAVKVVVDAGPETKKDAGAAGGAGMPGFSKANGGAWSRHAEDLLGMARPTGRR
ncbi:hypothetical protein VFPFJ_11485 [Purpureocillium lilacinum]|uniref:5'-3' DNA helicase ZGRF1-like N-terminal domain-containing protein n=1 Tax=Purpureocillium lilacinum TaxID=33203 RepID=A0A179F653_PURLI|nr:hypothetical protein VFPFJ_11485 [Purpureocillium lilacinum]OAQ60830.1 hypothetical protein VFPFJ_11485 [Purpureocillium lilacinum]